MNLEIDGNVEERIGVQSSSGWIAVGGVIEAQLKISGILHAVRRMLTPIGACESITNKNAKVLGWVKSGRTTKQRAR